MLVPRCSVRLMTEDCVGALVVHLFIIRFNVEAFFETRSIKRLHMYMYVSYKPVSHIKKIMCWLPSTGITEITSIRFDEILSDSIDSMEAAWLLRRVAFCKTFAWLHNDQCWVVSLHLYNQMQNKVATAVIYSLSAYN